jgi:hypothetical protein
MYKIQSNAGNGRKSLQPKNRWENLFVLLFPFITCVCVGSGLILLSFGLALEILLDQYATRNFLLPLVIHIVGFLVMFYGHVAGSDLMKAYWWLFRHEAEYDSTTPHQQTVKRQDDGADNHKFNIDNRY